MAFVNDINQEEKIVRPENLSPELPAIGEEKPKEEPVKPIEEPIVEATSTEVTPPVEGEEKTEEAKPGEEFDAFLERNNGKEFIEQAVQHFQSILSPNFDAVAYVDEMEEALPENLNGIAIAIANKYGDWLSRRVLGVSKAEVLELRKVKEDYLSRRENDEDAIIKEYEESDDDDKKEMARLMRRDVLYRKQQKENDEARNNQQAAQDRQEIDSHRRAIHASTFGPAEELFKKANISQVPVLKPGQAATREAVLGAMVRGAFIQLFDADTAGGGNLDSALESIGRKNFHAANPLKPILQDKANKYAKLVLDTFNDLLGKARKFDELSKQPAIQRKEPPVAGTTSSVIPAGNQVPQKALKVGSKDEDAWIAQRVRELHAEGKLSRPNGGG